MAMLHADKRATEAALLATKAEAAAVRMHDTLPQSSLRALMHQRTQAWAAERTALRKECEELREFKERMQLDVRIHAAAVRRVGASCITIMLRCRRAVKYVMMQLPLNHLQTAATASARAV